MGDSRAYRLRKSLFGKWKRVQLTQDSQKLGSYIFSVLDPTKHVTSFRLKRGDRLVLTTDGTLNGPKEKDWIEAMIHPNPQVAAEQLGDLAEISSRANSLNPNWDDVGIVVYDFW